MALGSTRQVRVKSVTWEAERILRYVLEDPSGVDLPRVRAGAHVLVHLGPDLARQYSLCGDPASSARYEIAVLREDDGLGGSVAMHERVRPGQLISISEPRNQFSLAPCAARHLLLAGGIGITPIMAMVAELDSGDVPWHLHYCTRSPSRTAFADRLADRIHEGKVSVHHDGGDPSRGLDLATTLAAREPGTHLYSCGPPAFMAAVAAASAHWPAGSVHSEYFTAPDGAPTHAGTNTAFRIRLHGSGEEMEVPAGRSIVEVLREHGHYVDTSCEEGYCGTCLTPYVDGEPEHRDTVLDEKDRKRYVLICCARSHSPTLVLDL